MVHSILDYPQLFKVFGISKIAVHLQIGKKWNRIQYRWVDNVGQK